MQKWIFTLLLVASSGSAIELFQKAPPLDHHEILFPLSPPLKKTPIRVYYFWATWCGPCHQASEILAKYVREFPDRVSVQAFSDEPIELQTEFLKQKYNGQSSPFPYGRIRGTFAPGPFSQDTPYYPYVFVVQDGTVIWRGMPTYPAGKFDRFMQELLQSRWDRKAAETAYQQSQQLTAQLRTLKDRQNHLIQQRIQHYQQMVDINAALEKLEPDNYIYSRRKHEALALLYLIRKEQRGSHEEADKILRQYEQSYDEIEKRMANSKDDLAFLARDLQVQDKPELRLSSKARQLIERSRSLTGESQYSDFLDQVYAESLAEQGRWNEAADLLSKALQRAEAKQAPKDDLAFMQKDLVRYQDKARSECSSFFTCLKSGFRKLLGI